MGLAKHLEKISDRYFESSPMPEEWQRGDNDSRDQRNRLRQVSVRGDDPFSEPIRLIRSLYSYYSADSQLLSAAGSQWAIHRRNLERLLEILRPVSPDELSKCDWHELQRIEQRLTDFFSTAQRYGSYSRRALECTSEVTKSLVGRLTVAMTKLNQFNDELSKLAPDDPRRATLIVEEQRLEKIRAQLQRDAVEYMEIGKLDREVEKLWKAFRQQYVQHAVQHGYRPALQHLDRTAIHPDQEAIVRRNHSKWYRVEGVSGSGKTVILIHRALRLAQENPQSTVRIITINRALANLLEDTIKVISGKPLPKNLEVHSLYDFLIRCISLHDDLGKYRLRDDRSGERIPDAWRDFLNHPSRNPQRNVFAKPAVQALVEVLQEREGWIRSHAGAYLYDEMIYIQSAYDRGSRRLYLRDSRVGRKLPFSQEQRQACLTILYAWELYLEVGHLCGVHELTQLGSQIVSDDQRLAEIKKAIPTHHMLVDEYQDLSTLELRILKKMVLDLDEPNALFFAGDINQKVYAKQINLAAAGLNFRGRSAVIRKNYRNTQQILHTAKWLPHFYPPPQDESFEQYSPELSPYRGKKAQAINCTSFDQLKCILQVLDMRRDVRVAVVSENTTLLQELKIAATNDSHAPIELFRNEELDCWSDQASDAFSAKLVLSRMEAVKGFEFDTVIVADMTRGLLPTPGTPKSELWRSAAIVYGAMTRARDELIITFRYPMSPFLEKVRNRDLEFIDPPNEAQIADFISTTGGSTSVIQPHAR